MTRWALEMTRWALEMTRWALEMTRRALEMTGCWSGDCFAYARNDEVKFIRHCEAFMPKQSGTNAMTRIETHPFRR